MRDLHEAIFFSAMQKLKKSVFSPCPSVCTVVIMLFGEINLREIGNQ